MKKNNQRRSISFTRTLVSILGLCSLAVWMTACVTTTPPGIPLLPTATNAFPSEPTPTSHVEAITPTIVSPGLTQQGEAKQGIQVTLDVNGVAQSFLVQVIPAVPASANSAWWEPLPRYTRLSLQGYTITDSLWQPQVFIYPVNGLEKANDNAGKVVASLKALIQSPQEIANMPFLPLTGDVQMMHTQLQYLDFRNGKGLRYLVEYGSGISPINNIGLIYTYQGITNDGEYYVAAVLPATHPSLPKDATITGEEPPEFSSDYTAYRARVARELYVQAAQTFAPDLTRLDAMMSSLEIR